MFKERLFKMIIRGCHSISPIASSISSNHLLLNRYFPSFFWHFFKFWQSFLFLCLLYLVFHFLSLLWPTYCVYCSLKPTDSICQTSCCSFCFLVCSCFVPFIPLSSSVFLSLLHYFHICTTNSMYAIFPILNLCMSQFCAVPLPLFAFLLRFLLLLKMSSIGLYLRIVPNVFGQIFLFFIDQYVVQKIDRCPVRWYR